MALPTSSQVGMPVTQVLDDTSGITPAPDITSSQVGQIVVVVANGTFTGTPAATITSDLVGETVTYVPASAAATPVSAPVAQSATTIFDTQFTANWSTVSGASGYLLDVSTASNFSTFVSGYNGLAVSGTSQSVTGLVANTGYFYRLRATNGQTVSANSNTISQTTTNLALSLFAYYKLGEDGASARVSSKSGAPNLNTAGMGSSAGKVGNCADSTISGFGNALEEATNANFQFTTSFTASMWLQSDGWNTFTVLLGMAGNTGTDWNAEGGSLWFVFYDPSYYLIQPSPPITQNALGFRVIDANNNAFDIPTAINTGWIGADDAEWHNVIVTYDSATFAVTLYVDGALVSSATMSAAIGTDGSLGFGAKPFRLFNDGTDGVGIAPYLGLMDEVIAWKRKLSQAEIQEVVDAGNADISYPF